MKAGKIGFVFVSGLLFLLLLALMELNQQTAWGMALFLAVSALFWFAHHKAAKSRKRGLRGLLWFAWLICFSGIVYLSWPPVQAVPAVAGRNPAKTSIVRVAQGDVQGVYTADGAVEVYTGIPYALAPVGENRWREPRDPEPWEGVLQADHFAPMSMQPVNLPIYEALRHIVGYHDYKVDLTDNYRPPVSEDSLYLNIWKPAGEKKNLPVLVYIHGGSLQSGQTWFGDYDGQGLAREDVIVVNFAYRLGVFGYFADEELARESENGTTGNYGLLDQIKALDWVHENIASFGGDPDNVTLAGESAGSASVSALCASPLARGLFRRAVLESSTVASVTPPHSFRLLEDALESGEALKKRYGCETADELRDLPAEKLVEECYTQHHITVDGYALTQTPYEAYMRGYHNEEAIFHGFNSRESGPFVLFSQARLGNFESKVRAYFGAFTDEVLGLYHAKTDEKAKEDWAMIYGAAFFDYPHYCLNRLAVKNRIPVYEYWFTRENGRLGPWHSGEEIYLYGNIPEKSKLFDARDRELSEQMRTYLVNFIYTGDPNGAGLPKWEQNLDSLSYLEFGDETAMTTETRLALFEIFDRMDSWR